MTPQQIQTEIRSELWRRGDLSWKLWPQQVPIYGGIRNLETPAEIVVMLCARQFGKSHLGVMMAVEDCLRHPDSCILVVGPTLKQTREIVTPRIKNIVRDAPPGLIRQTKSENKWTIGSSELVIGGFDVSAASQRGKTVQNIYIEEVVDSHPDEYVEAMRSDLGPALTHSRGGKMIFLTTLPRVPDHPFITDTMVEAKLSKTFFSYTIDDNKELTSEQYNACVTRSGGRASLEFRREYLNEIIRDASLVVVPGYNESIHVTTWVDPSEMYYTVAGDFGGTRDKSCFLLLGYDFLSDVDLVFDELVFESNTPTSAIAATLKARFLKPFSPQAVYADCPGQIQIDLQETHALSVEAPHKADWKAGINLMQVRFALNKVKVHPRCVFLRQSLESGTFNRKREDFERTRALGHCDALAALMYGLRCLGRESPFTIEGKNRPTNQFTLAHHIGENTKDSLNFMPLKGINFKPKLFGKFRR